VCDAWSTLDLAPHGFRATVREPWFVRPPGPIDPVIPPDLEIVRVQTPAEVAEFELASIRGFGDETGTVERGSIHPAAVLADPRMTMLTGRAAGRAVAVAMSYRLDHAVGIYGVATLASARGRGYGSALTASLVDRELPASLSPSPAAESLYRRLGFARVGELTMWRAPANRRAHAPSELA
jgi:ribosomal protein S18 acetylase RimI-like enzyme